MVDNYRVLNLASNDYANMSHNNAKALRSIGVDCFDYVLNPHPFGYESQSEIVRRQEIISMVNKFDIIQIFHSCSMILNLVNMGKFKGKLVVYHSGSRYRARIYYDLIGGSPYTSDPHLVVNSGTFYFTTTPPYSSQVTSSYWSTGSVSSSVLTGSQFNSDIYGITYQNEVTGSGYDYPYQLFTVERGDIIRFSANETQTYLIINVSAPSENANNALYLTLDRPLVVGTNTNSFLIKRYVPNANIVLIDAEKTGTVGSGAGFLMPEYASETLLTKFDSIVQDLTAKGII